MPPSWMLDEAAHAGPEHLDPEFVAGFDGKQGHPDPAPDLDLLASYGVESVVDLGAGTGQFAVPAARRFRRVVAVDVSPAMLGYLRSRAEAEGVTLELVQAGFLGYAHVGEPADAVYTRHALHQLPDFWKVVALHRIARVLRPGGVLRLRDLIYDFPSESTEQIMDGWVTGGADDPSQGYTGADYAEHVRTEHSTFRWLLEPMLDHAGFDIADVSYDDGGLFGAYTCIRRPA
ncbi:class I SAM-dependent methyltransferase [Jiangella ureilytica]|uniref:Class I SAM-dependent methyltransferase n=1 Tax=Jiangella ureilytica TaxID=2530374 RepID=A0A4R4RS71_9ACTN|nr:class I SAM-dependent methyltransferase [Jiangella ureilytica]TDC52109.1 class I SAM-dependent methyltransferase [Jiangella ureilytica]